jgi:ribulose-phosphate 3-epimerase
MGTLSASILAADLAHLADQVKLIEDHAEVIHIDIMDAHLVPPLTIGPVVVAALRPLTERVIHGHLLVETPETFFDELADAGLDLVSFHHEAVADPAPVIAKARGAGMRVGMALDIETAVTAVFPYLDELDDVVLMCVRPGRAGQELDPEVYPRLEAMRAEVDRRRLTTTIEIEGGVGRHNARRAIEAGASVLVAGSAIFGAPDPVAAAQELAAIARGEAA